VIEIYKFILVWMMPIILYFGLVLIIKWSGLERFRYDDEFYLFITASLATIWFFVLGIRLIILFAKCC
jgi:hypothetical protein